MYNANSLVFLLLLLNGKPLPVERKYAFFFQKPNFMLHENFENRLHLENWCPLNENKRNFDSVCVCGGGGGYATSGMNVFF